MRHSQTAATVLAGVTLAAALLAGKALAQRAAYPGRAAPRGVPAAGRAAREASEPVRIRKVTGVGQGAVLKTPEYRSTVPRGTKPAKRWGVLTVTYDTAPEWIDELTIQYYALALITERGKKAYSLYKNAVRCQDIEEGRAHLSAMFLRPSALKRYGDVIAVAVEIILEGKVVAEATEGDRMPAQWWKNPAVTEREDVTQRGGYLLTRSESPFALVNIDDYEYIRFR